MSHYFYPEVAVKYGTIESIILSSIHHIMSHNFENNTEYYFREGKWWVTYSIKAFQKRHYYLTDKQIRRALNSLEEKGAITTGNFNPTPYDRTKWYTVTKEAWDIFETPRTPKNNVCPFGQMENSKRANEKFQTGKCNNRGSIKGNNKEKEAIISDFKKSSFTKFWAIYDMDYKKDACEKLFYALPDKDIEKILKALPGYVKITYDSVTMTGSEKKGSYYRKHPFKWLKEEGWKDTVKTQEKQQTGTGIKTQAEALKEKKEKQEADQRALEIIQMNNDNDFNKMLRNQKSEMFQKCIDMLTPFEKLRLQDKSCVIGLGTKKGLYTQYKKIMEAGKETLTG